VGISTGRATFGFGPDAFLNHLYDLLGRRTLVHGDGFLVVGCPGREGGRKNQA
jgi:hypothetical protein